MLFTDISSEQLIKVLRKVGFWLAPTGGRKHVALSSGRRRLTIPRHSRLNPYTLKGIIRDAGLTDKEFKKLL